jgi:dienelactone hydrolase
LIIASSAVQQAGDSMVRERTGDSVRGISMRAVFALLIAATASLAAGPAQAAGNPESIEIPRDDHLKLKAVVYRPEGAGPFPAVIGLHNCTGLHNNSGEIGVRYRDWGQRLAKEGFVVLFPDSNGSRGLGSQCGSLSQRSLRNDRERVADAAAARAWLQQQSWVVADRVSLMGWSSGGIAALWTVRAARLPPDGKDFRAAVALYPGCRRLANAAWSARVPTLILIGRADDQSSAAACQQMVAGARGRSARVTIQVYPGAYHDFDHPNRPLQVRSGLAFSSDGSGFAHSGTHPSARADALKRVPDWFRQ